SCASWICICARSLLIVIVLFFRLRLGRTISLLIIILRLSWDRRHLWDRGKLRSIWRVGIIGHIHNLLIDHLLPLLLRSWLWLLRLLRHVEERHTLTQ